MSRVQSYGGPPEWSLRLLSRVGVLPRCLETARLLTVALETNLVSPDFHG